MAITRSTTAAATSPAKLAIMLIALFLPSVPPRTGNTAAPPDTLTGVGGAVFAFRLLARLT